MSHHALLRAAATALAGVALAVTAAPLAAALPDRARLTAPASVTDEADQTDQADQPDEAEATEASSGAVTWALVPSGPEGPDGRVSLRHDGDPGGTVSDAVALTNFSDRSAVFELYAGTGTVTSGGDFDLAPDGPDGTDDASWVTVGPLDGATSLADGIRVELPPSTTVVVPVTVRIPANATPGDHPLGVVAELVAGDDAAVQLAARVGVRMHLRVAGDVVARLSPTQVRATWQPSWNPFAPGTLRVEYVVGNDGNVRLGAGSVASVEGPFGLAASSVEATTREILPGQGVPVTTELSAWPLGRSTVEVTVVPAVVGEDDVDAALLPATVTVTSWTIPWAQLASLAALVGGVLLVRRLRRRSAARTQARIDAAVAAATERERVGVGTAAEG